MKRKRKLLVKKEFGDICGTWVLGGNAAKLVNDKVEEERIKGEKKYGKQAAIQCLLCELWKLKQLNDTSQIGA